MNIAKLTSTAALVGMVLSTTSAFAQSTDTQDIRSDFREQITACRNLEDTDAKKNCFKTLRKNQPKRVRRVRERNGIVQDLSEDVRNELRACRDLNGNHEDKQDCMNTILEANGIELPMRPEHGNPIAKLEVSDEVKAELETCKENEDRKAVMDCIKATFEANDIEAPAKFGKQAGPRFELNLSEAVKAELQTCRTNNEDREDARACAEAIATSNGFELPEHVPNERNDGRRGNRGERNNGTQGE